MCKELYSYSRSDDWARERGMLTKTLEFAFSLSTIAIGLHRIIFYDIFILFKSSLHYDDGPVLYYTTIV